MHPADDTPTAAEGGSRLEIQFSASPARLADLRKAVRSGLAGRVSAEDLDDLILALNEAATNAVLHGSGRGHAVEVAVRVSKGWAEITILDRGRVQRPSRAWDDDRQEGDSTPASGRGLWLMGRLVDEVRLERLHPHGTRVTLRRRVDVPTADGGRKAGERSASGPKTT
jgi:anti-sigma regulatory factor (Ser/Thr protein kinase)